MHVQCKKLESRHPWHYYPDQEVLSCTKLLLPNDPAPSPPETQTESPIMGKQILIKICQKINKICLCH